MDYLQKIITDFELHSVDGIRECFSKGFDPNQTISGKPLIFELINMYTRGPLFKSCVKAFVDYGLNFEDKILLSVLLDDAALLDTQLIADKNAIKKKYSFNCAFTPLFEISLLHICALASEKLIQKFKEDYGEGMSVFRKKTEEFDSTIWQIKP